MKADKQKKAVATEALKQIAPGTVLGVGTGTTVAHLIKALPEVSNHIEEVVSSSEQTTRKLKKQGFTPVNLSYVGTVDLYIDSADECNAAKQLIKGGGGALTREKIIAACANSFMCIIEASKQVELLGTFPLPVEVIPMARSYVAREIVKLGGQPVYREGMTTDNGNIILDVHNLNILNPRELEYQINNITGVVTNGLFAHRGADRVLCAGSEGVYELP